MVTNPGVTSNDVAWIHVRRHLCRPLHLLFPPQKIEVCASALKEACGYLDEYVQQDY